jgi:hypothetical protein
MSETPVLRLDLIALRDAGIDMYGAGTHWIEYCEAEGPPTNGFMGVGD